MTLKKNEERSIGLLAYQFKKDGSIADLRALSSNIQNDVSPLDLDDAKALL